MSESDRDLMTNAAASNGSYFRFEFQRFPPELQDEIIEGLDSRKLTLSKAAAICTERGNPITGESIRRYYRMLIVERRERENRFAAAKLMQVISEIKADEAVKGVLIIAATAIVGAIQDGTLKLSLAEFAKLCGSLPKSIVEGFNPAAMGGGSDPPIDVAETKRKVRQEVYGIP